MSGHDQIRYRSGWRISPVHRLKSDHKKEDDDQERNDRPRGLHLFVPGDLLRISFTRACAKTKDRVNDCSGYDDVDEQKDNACDDSQIIDCTREWRLRIQRI
jgi:hypothetical protein